MTANPKEASGSHFARFFKVSAVSAVVVCLLVFDKFYKLITTFLSVHPIVQTTLFTQLCMYVCM